MHTIWLLTDTTGKDRQTFNAEFSFICRHCLVLTGRKSLKFKKFKLKFFERNMKA